MAITEEVNRQMSWVRIRSDNSYFYNSFYLGIGLTVIGFSFSWLIGSWLNRQLGGQTGDTYGAIVEWTEALGLCAIAYL